MMSVYEWTQNLGLPLFLIPQFFRAFRLRGLYNTHVAKLQGASEWPVCKVSSSRDRQYAIESQMCTEKKLNSEMRYARHLLWVLLLLLGYAAMWQWTIQSCMLLHTRDTLITLGLGFTLVVGLVIASFSIRHVKEAFGIKFELYGIVAVAVLFQFAQLFVVYQLQQQDSNTFNNMFPLKGSYHYVVAAWIFSSLILQMGMVILCNARASARGYDEIFDSFSEFFGNQIGRRYFEQYLSLEWASQYLLFWTDVEQFRIQFGDAKNDATKMSVVARNIYNKYLRDGSMVDVGLDHSLQMETGYALTSNVTTYLFDAAQDAVYVKMSQIYPRFVLHPLGRQCAAHLRGELTEVDMRALEEKSTWSVEHAEKLSAETSGEVGKGMMI